LYFLDPEGNCIEVYLDSPWHVPQPHGDDLDLEQTNETIMRTTLEAVRTKPGFMPREEYEAEMRRKFDS
jgi:catechol 2,3-dioxygenase